MASDRRTATSGVRENASIDALQFVYHDRPREAAKEPLADGGSVRIKIEDEVLDLGPFDAIRVHKDTMRSFEGGPEGVEILAIGAPSTGPGDGDIRQGWWSD